MFTLYIVIAVSLLISFVAPLMGEIFESKHGGKVTIALAILVSVVVTSLSAYTYPSLPHQETYSDMGKVTQMKMIGRGKYPDMKITTDRYIITVGVGRYPNVYVGAQLGKKYTIEGGQQHTLYCVDNSCYPHSMCEWNMTCWENALTHFKD